MDPPTNPPVFCTFNLCCGLIHKTIFFTLRHSYLPSIEDSGQCRSLKMDCLCVKSTCSVMKDLQNNEGLLIFFSPLFYFSFPLELQKAADASRASAQRLVVCLHGRVFRPLLSASNRLNGFVFPTRGERTTRKL